MDWVTGEREESGMTLGWRMTPGACELPWGGCRLRREEMAGTRTPWMGPTEAGMCTLDTSVKTSRAVLGNP